VQEQHETSMKGRKTMDGQDHAADFDRVKGIYGQRCGQVQKLRKEG
jgi:hypothetical protein